MKKESFFSKKNMVSLFIIIIMVSSVMGFIWGRDSTDTQRYNGYKFLLKNNRWILNVDKNKELSFNYLPQEVENINLSQDIVNSLSDKIEIDLTYDIDDDFAQTIAIAQQEMANNLNNIYIRNGLTNETSYNIPIITCTNATEQIPVIYIQKSNQTSLSFDNNCIIIEAQNEFDISRIIDRIIYTILGIM